MAEQHHDEDNTLSNIFRNNPQRSLGLAQFTPTCNALSAVHCNVTTFFRWQPVYPPVLRCRRPAMTSNMKGKGRVGCSKSWDPLKEQRGNKKVKSLR